MDLFAHMTTFVRIVETNSLSAAARSLDLSLPVVSRQLRALEEDLGTPLIRRTTRRMALTPHGRAFYVGAVRILRDLEETRERVSAANTVRGTLVVSAPITIALSLVVPRVAEFGLRYPEVELELRLEDHLVDFVREGVDVAVRGGGEPPDSSAYVARRLARFRRIIVASPSYLRKNGVPATPADLTRHRCLVQATPQGSMARWPLEHVSRSGARKIPVSGPVRSSSPIVLADLAAAGMGLALVADWLAAKGLANGSLVHVLPEWRSVEVPMWAIHRADQRRSRLIAAFVEALGSGDIAKRRA